MKPRWTLYVAWWIPTNEHGMGHFTSWLVESHHYSKRSARRQAHECLLWHLSASRIVRYGEPL